jgi:NTP pyrophosphatase (non-canonical NTP hydrolase)
LYEAVRSDRQLFSKNLKESQEEIADLMGKYRLLSNQLNQLKEEILSKEKQYTKDAQERKKVARYNDK